MTNQKKRAHGTGSVVAYKDGFRIKWSAPEDRGSKVLRGVTKKQAEAELRKILSALDTGTFHDDRKGTITFEAMATDYMALVETMHAPKTMVDKRSLLKTRLLPTFGKKKLNSITKRQIDIWWAQQADHKVTRRNAGYLLKKILEQAVDWGLLSMSPFNVKNLGKDESTARPTWDVADFDAVLTHVKPFYRPALEVMFAGHYRLGELIALNGSDVRGGMVSSDKQKTGMGFTTDTKTGQHKRIELLERGRKALESMPRVIGEAPLFSGERAYRMPRRSLQDAWNDACAAAGYENFHVHDIRHVGLSLLDEAGAPEKVIQQRAGHASPSSTRRYMHTNPRQHAKAVQDVDALVQQLQQPKKKKA